MLQDDFPKMNHFLKIILYDYLFQEAWERLPLMKISPWEKMTGD